MQDHSTRRARLLTVLFLVLLLAPAPLWLLLAPALDTTNYENRTLAAFPTDVDVEAWPAAFESWLGDHAPFRNQFMSLNGRLNWAVGTLDSGDVLLGKEHWLFLKDAADASSLSDYQGLTAWTEAELADFTQTLTTLRDRLAAHGTALAIVLAPAKEGVYSQYMPDTVPVVARPTRGQALADALQQAGLPLAWPQQALIKQAQTQQVYYKYDTHWNEAGAYLAVTQVQQLLGAALPPLEACTVAADPAQAAPTDLANVSAVWSLCRDDPYYSVDAPRAELLSRTPDGYRMRWQGAGEKTLLMLRDSFGEAMAPFLCARYGTGVVLHGSGVTADTLGQELDALPDVVVLESAERYASNLLSQSRLVLAWLDAWEAAH